MVGKLLPASPLLNLVQGPSALFLLCTTLFVILCPACSPSSPTSTPPTPPTSVREAKALMVQQLRTLADQYWTAFNAHDADAVLPLLHQPYRTEREEQIRKDINLMRRFRVQLGVREDTAPEVTGTGEARMFFMMREPLGTRRIHMAFLRVDNMWRITYAEETDLK